MKKLIFTLFLFSFSFFGFLILTHISGPISTTHAISCPNGETHIGVRVVGNTEVGETIKVEADTPEKAEYTLNFLKQSDNTVVDTYKKIGGSIDKGPDVFFNVVLSDSKFDAGVVYLAQVKNDALDPKCGYTPFTVREVNPVNFTAPTNNHKFPFGLQTLQVVEVTGVAPGEYYFGLGFQWKGDKIKNADGTNIFEPNGSGVIRITTICDNGEAFRLNCGDKFRSGKYTITLFGSDKLPRGGVTFTVADEDSDGGSVDPTQLPGLEKGDLTDNIAVSTGFANSFLSFGIGIGGGIAFLLMIFGAYRLMFAAGNPESVQQGQQIITAAIAGLLVIVFASFILRFLGLTILGLGGL